MPGFSRGSVNCLRFALCFLILVREVIGLAHDHPGLLPGPLATRQGRTDVDGRH